MELNVHKGVEMWFQERLRVHGPIVCEKYEANVNYVFWMFMNFFLYTYFVTFYFTLSQTETPSIA